LKPAKHENLPVDLFSHGRTNNFFPHEPTANQWFSESQFESYRNLGFETVEQVCRMVDEPAAAADDDGAPPAPRRLTLAEFADAAGAEANRGRSVAAKREAPAANVVA